MTVTTAGRTPTAPLRLRPAAVAGTFYPADPAELAAGVDAALAAADGADPDLPPPRALVVPHAGHRYSGAVAASGYVRLRPIAGEVRRVVLLGPAHRVGLRALGVSSADAWRTPLGDVPIDAELRTHVLRDPAVEVHDRAHAPEHSLEVHLPFLQRVLDPGWSLLPLVVGRADPAQVARVIDLVWDDPETLVVVSTDLSHYHPYDEAAVLDRATAAAIVAGRSDIEPTAACGAHPLCGLLRSAGERHLDITLLDLRSSGDTFGDRRRVVGYGSFALTEPDEATRSRALLDVAVGAIGHRLATGAAAIPPAVDLPPALREPGACFVTLEREGRLLGCIGSIEPRRPLGIDAAANALGAAFRDPRFAPIDADDFAAMDVEVSVLSAPAPLHVDDIEALGAALRPGIDGVLIDAPGHRATFLPSVWAKVPDTRTFLEHLWRKAGLRPFEWPEGLQAHTYTADVLHDHGPRPRPAP